MRLNDRTVTNSTPRLPAGKNEVIFFDEDVPGFGLRLRDGGSRAWVFQYKVGGKHRRVTLGKYPKLSAKRARELVDGLAAKLALGQDPAAEKFESRARKETFKEIADQYITARSAKLRPRTLVEVERYLTKLAKPLHSRIAATIGLAEIADLLATAAANNGPVTANRARSTISAMFSWAQSMGRLEKNPAAFTEKQDENPHPHVLSADELRAIWAALPADGDYANIVRLLMLTGQRRDEIGGLRWSEIDMKGSAIKLPPARTKNGREHIVPMSGPVKEIIAALPRTPDRDLVFGYGAGGFSGWSRCKERLDAAVNSKRKKPIADWKLHDLRRTCATGMADIGVMPHVIEAALNHISGHKGGVAGIYNRSTYTPEVREALARWAVHLMEIVGDEAKRRKSGRAL
jgi:integrase